MNDLADLQNRLGYRFRDEMLLQRALTHGSFLATPGQSDTRSNQRLEFLGDRVLGLAAAEWLFAERGDADEGDLTSAFHPLVRKEACAHIAEKMGLDAHMRTGSVETHGSKTRLSILGDACEAVLGAIYLDGGYDAAKAVFERFWIPEADHLSYTEKDAIVILHEWALKRFRKAPTYVTVDQAGEAHAPVFEVEVRISDIQPALGKGRSLKQARREAAEAFIKREKLRER